MSPERFVKGESERTFCTVRRHPLEAVKKPRQSALLQGLLNSLES